MLLNARDFLRKLVILPPRSSLAPKGAGVFKRNPYLRALTAEPLEERLPVCVSSVKIPVAERL